MITQIRSVAIGVTDYEKALKFFRDALGFEITADIADPRSAENRWLTLKPRSGQTNLMLIRPSSSAVNSSQRGKSTHIVMDTDNIQTECERLRLGGAMVLYEPKQAGWGNALETHFSDRDGNIFMLVQSLTSI